mmetsp:Transcript_56808/g.116323  ORF Transcript_56808/g.116323 Transcript_56808/m.116323 type:complete len:356 (-) Transcript_56808:270-1337(-)
MQHLEEQAALSGMYASVLGQPMWQSMPARNSDYSLPHMHQMQPIAPSQPSMMNSAFQAVGSNHSAQGAKRGRNERGAERGGTHSSSRGHGKKVARVFPRRKAGEEKRSTDLPVVLTKEMLFPLFAIPLRDAAEMMGLCPTALKSVCRRLGIDRWPFQNRRGGPARSPKAVTEGAKQSTNSTAFHPTNATNVKEEAAEDQEMVAAPPSNCSPTGSMMSESSEASSSCSTACSSAPTEAAEYDHDHHEQDVPNCHSASGSPASGLAKTDAVVIKTEKRGSASTWEWDGDAGAQELLALAHTEPLAQQPPQPHQHSWEAMEEQQTTLFQPLDQHCPWDRDLKTEEVSSCDMAFLSIRL